MRSEHSALAMAAGAILLLAGCAGSGGGTSAGTESTPRPGRVDVSTFAATGEPVRCVPLMATSLTPAGPNHVMARSGSRTWRNELRGSCPTLREDRVLVVRPSAGSQVCEMDTFEVLDPMSRATFGTCVFGPFTPVDVPRGARW